MSSIGTDTLYTFRNPTITLPTFDEYRARRKYIGDDINVAWNSVFFLGSEGELPETLTFAPSAGTLEAPVRFVAPLSVPTAIPMTTINAENNEAIYDLQGRRVNTATRGVTIQNGKAIIR